MATPVAATAVDRAAAARAGRLERNRDVDAVVALAGQLAQEGVELGGEGGVDRDQLVADLDPGELAGQAWNAGASDMSMPEPTRPSRWAVIAGDARGAGVELRSVMQASYGESDRGRSSGSSSHGGLAVAGDDGAGDGEDEASELGGAELAAEDVVRDLERVRPGREVVEQLGEREAAEPGKRARPTGRSWMSPSRVAGSVAVRRRAGRSGTSRAGARSARRATSGSGRSGARR